MGEDMRNIHQRILDTMRMVPYITREERAKGMQYRAVSHDHLTHMTRPYLIANGINLYSTVLQTEQEGNRTEVLARTYFVNAENPEDMISVDTVGYGINSQDKGPGIALTYAVKTAILKVLNVESGTEDEADFHNEDYAAADTSPTTTTLPIIRDEGIDADARAGRAAMIETVRGWMEMSEQELGVETKKNLAIAIREVVNIYYGPDKWFSKHIKEKYPKEYGDGSVNTLLKIAKPKIVNTLLKVRARALELAAFNQYDHIKVHDLIRSIPEDCGGGVDPYSLDEDVFVMLIDILETNLKGQENV